MSIVRISDIEFQTRVKQLLEDCTELGIPILDSSDAEEEISRQYGYPPPYRYIRLLKYRKDRYSVQTRGQKMGRSPEAEQALRDKISAYESTWKEIFNHPSSRGWRSRKRKDGDESGEGSTSGSG